MERPSTLESRSFGNNRPSSAAPQRLGTEGGSGKGHRWNTGTPGGAVTGGFRPGSGGARLRTARGVGTNANANANNNFLPPAGSATAVGSQSTPHLFSPAALSAKYGPLSDGARKVRFGAGNAA